MVKVIPILQSLLGLVPRNTSNGSWLQLREGAWFQGKSDQYKDYPWPTGDYWIVGRELLIYKSISLLAVPKAHRRQVLTQNITRLSPFQSTGHYVIEKEAVAEVWVWDEAQRLEELGRVVDGSAYLEPRLQRLEAIPETLLFKPKLTGTFEQPMAEGVELQVWKERRLTNSSWQANGEAEEENSVSTAESWLGELDRNAPDLEPIIWRLGFWLLGLFMVYQAGVFVGWSFRIDEYEKQHAEETVRAADLIEIRRAARLERQLSDQLTVWHSQPLQMAIIAEFDGLIPETAELRNWSYHERQLRVTVYDPELNNRAYIENLEGSQTFANVKIEPGVLVNTAMIELSVRL